MKNIIFLAPPAAGKGTISKFLQEKYNYQHISTGNLFRNIINQNSKDTEYLKSIVQKGNLVEDETMFRILKQKLKTLEPNISFILDGVPRTLQQAQILDIILRDLGFSDYIVLNIRVEKDILYRRFTGRRICSNCQKTYNIYFEKFKPHKENTCDECGSLLEQRVDDTENAFHVRYEVFEKNNKEIIAYYNKKGYLYNIDYNENETEALESIQRIVGAFVDK